MRILIKHLLAATEPREAVTVKGWVRTRRDAKGFSFLALNDGSCAANVQVVVDAGTPGAEQLPQFTTGASAEIEGRLVPSPAAGQKWELRATRVALIGAADATYPLQKKGHTPEFLRTIAHLRPRSNLFGAMFRLRSRLAFAVHQFFQERDFVYVHTPIITASDCEGAGELFRVSTLDLANLPRKESGEVDFSQDFFGKESFLTVSGQLELETHCLALSRVYTFGPTFRAENSNTSRHLAEFWMVEPEVAFADLTANADLAERFLKFVFESVLGDCQEELGFFRDRVDSGCVKRLEEFVTASFERMEYTEAIRRLEARQGEARFEFPIRWGMDLQSEHERFLTERIVGRPVVVMNYPQEIKAFYMRRNDDGRTVAAMDVLAPGIGEIIGGAQREERLDVFDERLRELGMSAAPYWWYRDLRRYGTVPHAGFGLGLERTLVYVTGLGNIRDVIPFPRTPGSADF